VPEDRPDPHDLPPGDLDAGLRDRLRHAREGGGELTRSELLELAETLARQRQELAGALADLKRREAEAAAIRDALERASREAAQELDGRDAQLAALAQKLMLERSRLDRREQAVSAAERRLAALTTVEEAATVTAAPDELPIEELPIEEPQARPGRLESLEGVVKDLRGRLERIEDAFAARVRGVTDAPDVSRQPETEGAPVREDRFARVMDAVEELVRLLRGPLQRLAGDENTEAAASLQAPPEGEAAVPEREAEPEPDLARPEPSLPAAAAAQEPSTGYLLFVSTSSGYRLVERDGSAAPPGSELELTEVDGEEFRSARAVVTGRRPSPLPDDLRPCLVCTLVAGGADRRADAERE
jgi:hypothetical protein